MDPPPATPSRSAQTANQPRPARSRKRIRKVPDDQRRRSAQACEQCKERKTRCIRRREGVCEYCFKAHKLCRFRSEKTTDGLTSPDVETASLPQITAQPASSAEPSADVFLGRHVHARTNLEGGIVAGNQDDREIASPPSAHVNPAYSRVETDFNARMPDQASPGRASAAAGDGRSFAMLSPSQSSSTGDFTIDSHPLKSAMWPKFLSRLREAFSLDSPLAPAEQEGVMVIQPSHSTPPPIDPAEVQRLREAAENFPPNTVTEFLLNVCVDHGTDSFFYFDQAQFRLELAEFHGDPMSPLRWDSSFLCIAHATFALGSQWTTLLRPEGSINPDDGDPGRKSYHFARALLPDIIERPSIRSIQALYLLGVYLLPASAIETSYIYMGLALRKAMALDLHQDTDDPSLDRKEKEIRKRLWWSIYSLERSVTVKLNRPRSISREIISVSLPEPYPLMDSTQRFDNVLHQIADAKLALILDKLTEPTGLPCTNDTYCEFETELKEWKRSLPSSFRLSSIHPKDSSYRAVFHLYLNYYYAWIAMGKVSVVTVVRANLRYRFGKDAQPPNIAAEVNARAKSCVKAAKKMLQLFDDIKQTGNLTRFSFTDFQGCSVATIIALLAGILERDSGYESRVRFGLDCLCRMAEGNATARTGVRFVQALQAIADEAVEKSRERVARTSEGTGDQPSQYHDWVAWFSGANQTVHASTSSAQISSHGTLARQHDTSAWPASQTVDPGEFTTWDGAAALQQLSGPHVNIPVSESRVLGVEQPGVPQPPIMDSNFSSMLYNDDQAYLMGLTGMDVLNFSDFAV